MIRIAAILLAAGASIRFGGANKLLAVLDGRAVITHTTAAVAASRVREIVVVTAPDDAAVRAALAQLPCRFVTNPAPERGMGSSIASGIAALDGSVGGAFVVPGDMPHLETNLLDRLIDAFDAEHGRAAIYPVTPEGKQRNPVLWPAHLFARLAALDGPHGAKAILRDPALRTHALPWHNTRTFHDIDIPEDLDRA